MQCEIAASQGTGPGGKKDDAGKLQAELIPADAVAAVYELATPYDTDEPELTASELYDHTLLHLVLWRATGSRADLACATAYAAQWAAGTQRAVLPGPALADVARVLQFGAGKYGPNSWQQVPDGVRRYYAATLRHIWLAESGESLDPESGLPHLAHAVCNLLFLLHLTSKQEKRSC